MPGKKKKIKLDIKKGKKPIIPPNTISFRDLFP
jgi:hypothetical protein